jgi:hypothetical protein
MLHKQQQLQQVRAHLLRQMILELRAKMPSGQHPLKQHRISPGKLQQVAVLVPVVQKQGHKQLPNKLKQLEVQRMLLETSQMTTSVFLLLWKVKWVLQTFLPHVPLSASCVRCADSASSSEPAIHCCVLFNRLHR